MQMSYLLLLTPFALKDQTDSIHKGWEHPAKVLICNETNADYCTDNYW